MEYLEIFFDLRGKTLPSDHGYSLYSAIKGALKKIESNVSSAETTFPADVLLSSISGVPNQNGVIYLNRYSRFRLRCPSDQVRHWYQLQNQVLDIQGHLIRLVRPKLTLPQPSDTLKARLVTFKLETIDHGEVPRYFLESCKKGLEALEIKGQPFIDSNDHGNLARRIVTIKHKKVVGYGVVIEGLDPNDSIKLQCLGLGGRKHFGCGWFYPTKEDSDVA